MRDGFTCAYCGRQTIPLPIMRLISVRFGDTFGYHLNWKAEVTHRLYWDIQASLDHVVPVSGGGDWQALDNLATACSRCQYQKGNRSLEDLAERLTPDLIGEHLYTGGQPDPDLVIRTSGEQRLSDFMLWQAAHSEFYFVEALGPDLRQVDFLRALRDYEKRHRRFGG